MKPCARSNCFRNSIPRGKYCEEHRVTKKKIPASVPAPEIRHTSISPQVSVSEIERRLLIDEQNSEYNETMRLDLIRNQEKEQKMLEKAFKESEMDQIRQIVFGYEKTDDSFNIKFSINGKQQIHYFNSDAIFKDIFEYIDLYLYDIGSEIEYDLIYYPNTVFSKDEYNELKLLDSFNCKCLSLLVRNKNL